MPEVIGVRGPTALAFPCRGDTPESHPLWSPLTLVSLRSRFGGFGHLFFYLQLLKQGKAEVESVLGGISFRVDLIIPIIICIFSKTIISISQRWKLKVEEMY